MLCCGFCCGNMSKRDYKVATMDGIELEPLGGEKMDKDKEKDKEKQTNGVTFVPLLCVWCDRFFQPQTISSELILFK
ncbi:hypothetical protein FF38_03610 [Lucilia cuprina]|uniref:Uncharacterized protein n=1 Tax=Lucilia cuprina TaxID=7375 RepID=A0A0L0CSS6_LUCCU|nr:hypothetical protein FF38_03610 [Lucilia cuprina]